MSQQPKQPKQKSPRRDHAAVAADYLAKHEKAKLRAIQSGEVWQRTDAAITALLDLDMGALPPPTQAAIATVLDGLRDQRNLLEGKSTVKAQVST